jgi:hypothetical protein
MLSVKPELEVFVFGIDIVEDGISIGPVRSSENPYLKKPIGLLETLAQVRSNVEASLYKQVIFSYVSYTHKFIFIRKAYL